MIPLLLLSCIGPNPASTPQELPTLIITTIADSPNRLDFEVLAHVPSVLTCQSNTIPNERHEVLVDSLATTISVFGLLADHSYECHLKTTIDGVSKAVVSTPPLPDDMPDMTIIGAGSHTDYTLFHYGTKLKPTQKMLIVVDSNGNIRWYYRTPSQTFIDVDASFTATGDILYGGGGSGMGGMDPLSTLPVVLDKSGSINNPNMTVPSDSLHHHCEPLDNNEALALLYAQNDDDGTLIHGSELRHLDLSTGDVIWRWDTQYGIDSGDISPDADLAPNAIHPNWAAARESDYLINLFFYESILSIDPPTGDINWSLGRDGDFTLLEANGDIADPARWFSGIHGADVQDNTLVVYDNLYSTTGDGDNLASRVLRLELDEVLMTATITGEYRENGWLEPYFGSVQTIDGDTVLIGMGHCGQCSYDKTIPLGIDHYSAMVRVDIVTGDVSWRLSFANYDDTIYRTTSTNACHFLPTNRRYCAL